MNGTVCWKIESLTFNLSIEHMATDINTHMNLHIPPEDVDFVSFETHSRGPIVVWWLLKLISFEHESFIFIWCNWDRNYSEWFNLKVFSLTRCFTYSFDATTKWWVKQSQWNQHLSLVDSSIVSHWRYSKPEVMCKYNFACDSKHLYFLYQ